MVLVKLIKDDDNWYSISSDSTQNFETFAFWLREIIPSYIDIWKNLIENLDEEKSTGGNLHQIKKEGDTTIIDYMYYDDDEEPYQYAVHIKQDNLLEILDQWKMLCERMPNEILIVRKDGKIVLEGRN